MTSRILLIGGTGFLGSFVAARLAERPLSVLVRPTSNLSTLPHGLDAAYNQTPGRQGLECGSNLSTGRQGLDIRVGDLGEPSTMPLDGVTALVYCASMGFGHVPPLIERLRRHSQVRRVIFVSTTAIFTSLPSRSKAVRIAAEDSVQASGLEWTILRPTMIYGTARDRNISRLLRFLKRSPIFPICGNGLWQPIHVEDLTDAVVAALDSSATPGQTYNLAGATPVHFDELVQTAARAVGRRVRLIRVPLEIGVLAAQLTRVVTPEQIRRLAEDKAFDISAARKDFNFNPRSFAEGVHQEARLLGLVPKKPV